MHLRRAFDNFAVRSAFVFMQVFICLFVILYHFLVFLKVFDYRANILFPIYQSN